MAPFSIGVLQPASPKEGVDAAAVLAAHAMFKQWVVSSAQHGSAQLHVLQWKSPPCEGGLLINIWTPDHSASKLRVSQCTRSRDILG